MSAPGTDMAEGENVIRSSRWAGGKQQPMSVEGERHPLIGGGGGGTSDGMEPRVAALEKTVDRIERKIDALTESLQRVAIDVAEMKGKIPSLASSADVVAVSSGLKDKPGIWQAFIISMVVSALTVAAALGGAVKFLGK